MIINVIGLTAFSDFVRKADLFQSELTKYFMCEFNGHNPLNPCNRTAIEAIENDALSILVYTLAGILPVVNLIFVINIQDVRRKFMSLCMKIKSSPSTSTTKNTGSSAVENEDGRNYHRYQERTSHI